MNIVFFGTSSFAIPALETLNSDEDINVLAVFTQPDKPAGRKGNLQESPIKKYAKTLDLKIKQPHNSEELFDYCKDYDADFFVVISYGMILKENILEIPEISCVNVHASILPKYRGASPIQEALLNGDNETGITFMKMDEKLDHGGIYMVKKTDIQEKENYPDLNQRLGVMSGIMLPHILKDIEEEVLRAIPQNHDRASFCSKITKKDGKIDWNLSAEKIINMLRAYTPWPGLYFKHKDKIFKIHELESTNQKLKAGEFKTNKENLLVGTKTNAISIKKIQPQGKKIMEIKQFLNGYGNLFT